MNTSLPRREFLRVAAGAALLGSSCRLLAQTPTPTAATAPESEEVARLKRQLEAQRAGSIRLLIELYDKHGAPLLDTIAAFTAAEWQARLEQRPFSGPRDLQAVKTGLWSTLPPSFKFETLEDTPQRLRFRVTECPVAAEMKQRQVPPALGYALNCASDSGVAAGVNPQIKFSRTKTLMQGDECCDHCYEFAAT
ncbi:L-2-amino-thiazoline-4-carboxylic acid hydrolase [Opitutus terrae]|uniref:L-2-amino-thiazoline-4-carboxylic acid hydrolase n=1 Tax=Opitutus terrae (strain DSM 11246 / JCM 15787 / PB90-1) TaxID=452637 RepID=B1ZWI6_OPITP|nr:L-2-amino-thiazoline-4-carboxylic acid hydrolase [Opitutus terrae]ACB73310.1 hypothetical protein Oter_0018 [Opitutus terrae PB90-1]